MQITAKNEVTNTFLMYVVHHIQDHGWILEIIKCYIVSKGSLWATKTLEARTGLPLQYNIDCVDTKHIDV